MTMKERRSREHTIHTPTALTEAKVYEEHSLKELRNAGYRITMPRVQVIRALADTTKALSAYAIHEKIIGGGGKIDDRQPRLDQPGKPVGPDLLIVRPAMAHRLRHRPQSRLERAARQSRLRQQDAGYAAHGRALGSGGGRDIARV